MKRFGRRLILVRQRIAERRQAGGKLLLEIPGYRFQALGTNLPVSVSPLMVSRRYHGRADVENRIKELGGEFGIKRLAVKNFGGTEAMHHLAINPKLARKSSRHEGGILAIAAEATGSIYVSDGASIWTISDNRSLSSFAENISISDCAGDRAAELPKPHIRSLAVNARGDVYAAATGCRSTVQIKSSGGVIPMLRSESPWSPCAVVESDGDIYVME